MIAKDNKKSACKTCDVKFTSFWMTQEHGICRDKFCWMCSARTIKSVGYSTWSLHAARALNRVAVAGSRPVKTGPATPRPSRGPTWTTPPPLPPARQRGLSSLAGTPTVLAAAPSPVSSPTTRAGASFPVPNEDLNAGDPPTAVPSPAEGGDIWARMASFAQEACATVW